jgi:hypothetical protein
MLMKRRGGVKATPAGRARKETGVLFAKRRRKQI